MLVCAEVIRSNSAGGITQHLVNICILCEKCWLLIHKRTPFSGYMVRVLMDDWVFIALLFQWCSKHPICSPCCFEMRQRAQHSQCHFQVFGVRRAAIWPPTWSEAGYSTTVVELLHPWETLYLCAPHSLCDQCTHTHIYYATLLERWRKPQGNQPLNASLMQT